MKLEKIKKIRNFFRCSLHSKEIIVLIQSHMKNVCGRYVDVNPDNLLLLPVENGFCKSYAVIYLWNDLYWEVSFNREVIAYSMETAKVRYPESLSGKYFKELAKEGAQFYNVVHYLYWVRVRGKISEALQLKLVVP